LTTAPAAERRELFIYYRVPEADLAAACAALQTAQAALCGTHDGLQARLLRRPVTQDGWSTLMETYALAPHGIDAALQAQIECSAAAALAPWLPADSRHTETFIECR
jgi:hypothetical protein